MTGHVNAEERKKEWFREREYGFFFHFLNSGPANTGKNSQWIPMPPTEWNRRVDSFQVDLLAEQLHELRAGFAWLTVGQNSAYYCSPNIVYDTLTGYTGEASRCSRRDLIADFSDALAKYEIPLFVYSTCMAPGADPLVLQKLKCEQAWPEDRGKIVTPEFKRMDEFLKMWTDIHRVWAERWGRKIHGWWIDGTYNPEFLFDFPEEPNGESFVRALRAGNPDALVAFNPGIQYLPRRNYRGSPESMTAGEIFDPELAVPSGSSRFSDGLLPFLLTPAGNTWGPHSTLRYSPEKYAELTRNITDNGGVIAWDLPFSPEGISRENFHILRQFADEYRRSQQLFPKTTVRISPPVLDGTEKTEDGFLSLSPESSDLSVFWNGMPVHPPCRLPYSGRKEQRIELECGGWKRGFPVYAEHRLHLGTDFSKPFCIAGNDGTCIGAYSFALSGNLFRIHAEITEKEALICKVPWQNSCLELFLADSERFHRRQFCILHDGRVLEVHSSGILLPVPFLHCERSRSRESLLLDLTIELPGPYRNGGFRFEIQQSVNRNGDALHGVLFGANAESSSCYALVEPD